jgi:DNA-binding NarL/FixJ family response regulator
MASGLDVVGYADNGLDAIELAETLRPDVVVMDVVMGNVDGIEATREITRRAPDVRVVLLSGSDDENLTEIGRRAGATSHLVKGLPIADLVAAVGFAATAAASATALI